ncbi:hypothetical protein SCHPADRAFT_993119 [Schizopora paradoxa]|uniref:DUF6533 domain-containing protein n=1 Tax=Schizopora paradoxa TaxID=27342 RepID=A0A0H2SPX0_9AGAM|nr:hypothetical protein SCHPADRAFT_993119 [Schizopora paradoxa]
MSVLPEYVLSLSPLHVNSNYSVLLSREIDFVWKSNWSWGKIIYVSNRYGIVLVQTAGIPYWMMLNPSLNSCKYFFRLNIWFTYGFVNIVAYVAGVRTYALCSGKKGIKLLITSMFIVQFMVVISAFVLYEKLTKFAPSPFTGVSCLFTVTTTPRLGQILAYSAPAICEIGLCLISTARIVQLKRQGQSRLVAVVFRDNLVFIAVVTSSILVNVFLAIFVPEDHSVLRSTFTNVTQVVGSVICCRMLLHLRSYLQETEIGGENGHIVLGKVSLTTINFSRNQPPPRTGTIVSLRTEIGSNSTE